MGNDYDAQVLRWMADAARKELDENILPYWNRYAVDRHNGGFFGLIDGQNKGDPGHAKGLVAHARFLWTYAAGARTRDTRWLETAEYAETYLDRWFWDTEHGGFFWSVRGDGSEPVVSKKQIYGQAFALYGYSELLRNPEFGGPGRESQELPRTRPAEGPGRNAEVRTGENARGHQDPLSGASQSREPGRLSRLPEEQRIRDIRRRCGEIFRLLETYGRDGVHGGYREACEADWSPAKDRRLSPVDMDCEKSMNTNLHVLEAYTNYYRIEPTPPVAEALGSLIRTIAQRVVQGDHQGLFFTEDWSRLDRAVSYGHDIETSWLLMEAAEVLGDSNLRGVTSEVGRRMAAAVYHRGLDHAGWWLANEHHDPDKPETRDTTRIWWVQAEGAVGFLNAYQATGNLDYLRAAEGVWRYCLEHQRAENGEWHWALDDQDRPDLTREKGGLWKTPYHNGRACMEILERSRALLASIEEKS